MISELHSWLLTVLSAGIGAYLGAYLKRKAEDRATREALRDIVRQAEATTNATKSIEAKISTEVWDRQMQWEMKKEALFEALSALGRADDALVGLSTAYEEARKEGDPEGWRQLKLDKSLEWQRAINADDEKSFIAGLVCSRDLDVALRGAIGSIRSSASKVFKDQFEDYSELSAPVQKVITEALALAGKELGIDRG